MFNFKKCCYVRQVAAVSGVPEFESKWLEKELTKLLTLHFIR